MAPGNYIIGDPCYVIDIQNAPGNTDWADFINGINEQTGVVEYKGHHGVVYHTKYGDGHYRDNQHHQFPVDSGMIGAVPVAALQDLDPLYSTPPTNTEMTFDQPFQCRKDPDGTIHFGDIAIQ